MDNSQDKTIELLMLELDIGESSAFALALTIENSILILDETKARKLAKGLNLNFSGTFGLLLKAKEQKLIKSTNLKQKIESSGFHFSQNLIDLFE